MLEYSVVDRIFLIKDLKKIDFTDYRYKLYNLKSRNPRNLSLENLDFFSMKLGIEKNQLNYLLSTNKFLSDLINFIDKSLLNDE